MSVADAPRPTDAEAEFIRQAHQIVVNALRVYAAHGYESPRL